MNKDIVIVGAGTAGLTAAIYAARAGKSVLVLEQETVGGQIAFSPRVENYPGIASISGAAFADNLFSQAEALGVALELETVERIVPGVPHRIITDSAEHTAKAVIVATGVRHRRLGVPGEDLAGVSYCAVCDGAFYQGKTVALVGGGSTALQSAELLSGICREVHLIHRRTEFRGERALAERVRTLPNVKLHLSCTVTSLLANPEDRKSVGSVLVHSKDENRDIPLVVDGLFVCAGQIPGNQPFAGVLDLDEAGYLRAGEDCCTNVPGIVAAGDCRTKDVRQLTTAAADGSVAALAALAAL